jgi:hypothetical protein
MTEAAQPRRERAGLNAPGRPRVSPLRLSEALFPPTKLESGGRA